MLILASSTKMCPDTSIETQSCGIPDPGISFSGSFLRFFAKRSVQMTGFVVVIFNRFIFCYDFEASILFGVNIKLMNVLWQTYHDTKC